MPPTPWTWRRTSAADGGFSLLELVVAMALLMLVVGSILTVFESVQRSTAFVQDRSATLDEMRLAFDRITREVRQATRISGSSTSSRLELDTYVLGSAAHIVYEASGTTLFRKVGSGPAVPFQTYLASTSVFGYTYTSSVSDSTVVTVTLSVFPPRRPDTTLVLTSQVRPRNQEVT